MVERVLTQPSALRQPLTSDEYRRRDRRKSGSCGPDVKDSLCTPDSRRCRCQDWYFRGQPAQWRITSHLSYLRAELLHEERWNMINGQALVRGEEGTRADEHSLQQLGQHFE